MITQTLKYNESTHTHTITISKHDTKKGCWNDAAKNAGRVTGRLAVRTGGNKITHRPSRLSTGGHRRHTEISKGEVLYHETTVKRRSPTSWHLSTLHRDFDSNSLQVPVDTFHVGR